MKQVVDIDIAGRSMKKDSTLTAADLHNIVTDNFAPDIKKLAHEIGANLDNPAEVRAIGTYIVTSYGTQALRDVVPYVRTIYGGTKAINQTIGELYWCHRNYPGPRKRTTKAEAVARHIAALVKLLENEPDTIVGPILDNLLERINQARLRRLK